ncbi:MAG: hypothetical protein QOD31_163, partial [Pseudonocardiales bacterium]|nr:hypothetical protein [Pseudonocardiales bacterium]
MMATAATSRQRTSGLLRLLLRPVPGAATGAVRAAAVAGIVFGAGMVAVSAV